MSNKEKAEKMRRCGKTIQEISEELGISQATVRNYVYGVKVVAEQASEFTPGWNKDRKGCRKCIFRNKVHNESAQKRPGCNYIIMSGHSRGCKVEDCSVCVKESRKKNGKNTTEK